MKKTMMAKCILMSVLALAACAAEAVDFAAPQAEFAKYHKMITGRDPLAEAVAFSIDSNVSASGKDAYAIKSTGAGVAITGSNLRSVWYGLYDLLERRGGCHWFWDGDVVPKMSSVDLSGLDVREEAHFEYRGIRYFAHRGLTRFQAEQWGPTDWKREIDWLVKRRLNVFMLRIGQDDLFQRTFPEICAYPDPAKPLPGHGRGFDNRSLFWSLQFRGELRRDIQKYAFERGLMVPEDFGTMTHWYSRTPQDFLEKAAPPFLPQSTGSYSEKNGLVWDVRDPRWVDMYWSLTRKAVETYGQGAPAPRLLHTIGLGERRCFTNRTDNLNMKMAAIKAFVDRAHRDYPEAKVLLAGWDFYFTWHPDEVQALVKTLDPKRDIIWDYEGDATRDYRPEMKDIGGNNFTKWGVMGKFPYTYSIFLAYESALDIRANYPLIESRQKLVQNDPSCAGYILWPESSHTDTLLLEFFVANAWLKKPVDHHAVLDRFCAGRYGDQSAAMRGVWEKVIPLSYLLDWGDNYGCHLVHPTINVAQHGNSNADADIERWERTLSNVRIVFSALAAIDWEGEAIRRDTVDLARTALDRLILLKIKILARDFGRWTKGERTGEDLGNMADEIVFLCEKMADLLELHTDYSLWESYLRLNAIEKVMNPGFPQILMENAANAYCRSHHYELARYLYLPRAKAFASRVSHLVKKWGAGKTNGVGDKLELDDGTDAIQALMAVPLEVHRPRKQRTSENFHALMLELGTFPGP